jgi:hypothetical protein
MKRSKKGQDRNPFQQFGDKAYRPARTILFDDDDSRTDPWLDALEAFDNGDKAPLIDLMKSGYPMPPAIVPHIGDLLERYEFKRPAGAPRKASYDMSETDVALNSADAAIDDLMATGKWKLPDAVAEIAAQRGIPVSKMNEHHAGRRRSQRKR